MVINTANDLHIKHRLMTKYIRIFSDLPAQNT